PHDRVRFDDGVDDRAQGTELDGVAEPVERLALRPREDAVKSEVTVDRLFEIATQLDDRPRRSTLSHADEARGKQSVARTIGTPAQRAPGPTHGGGNDIPLFTVDHDPAPEIMQERLTRPARRRHDADALHARKLNEQPSHTAARAVDEHRFPGTQRETIEQLERGRARP